MNKNFKLTANEILSQMHWATHTINQIPKLNKQGQYQTTLNITVKKQTGKKIQFRCQGQTIDLTRYDFNVTQEDLDILFPEIIKLYNWYSKDIDLTGVPETETPIFFININL